MKLEDYLAKRRRYEILAWAALLAVQIVANTSVTLLDIDRAGRDVAAWEVITWEVTSSLVIGALLPVMLFFDARFPLQRGTWRRNLAWHAAFTVAWSLMHVLAMTALREIVYGVAGSEYAFASSTWNFFVEFFYEYLKDVRSYASILAAIYLYRFILRRLRGEASFVPEGETDAQPQTPDRFLVKKLGREFLVNVNDIDWIESSGNYVTLHVGERLYPLRETMASIETRLDARGFARVHRGAILNLDRVKEIEPFDTGDARAHLASGGFVPVSRRYRQELRNRLG